MFAGEQERRQEGLKGLSLASLFGLDVQESLLKRPAEWRLNLGGRQKHDRLMPVQKEGEILEILKRDKNCEVVASRSVGGNGDVTQVQHWLKQRTGIWSLKCQYMTNARAQDISRAIAKDKNMSYVCLQGTQQEYGKGEFRLEQWSTNFHDVWELRQKRNSGKKSYPAGVVLMAPVGTEILSRTYFSLKREMKTWMDVLCVFG